MPDLPAARVSVVIPTRNNLDTLPEAIRSVGYQRMTGIELVVVDDGSTDGSREWLAEVAVGHPALRVIHTPSLGPAGARNTAISACSAPIVAFLDADDVWLRGKLRVQVEHLEKNPEVGFSFTDYRHVGPDGEDRGTCFEYWKSPFRFQPPSHFFTLDGAEALLLGCNLVGTSTVAARKALLQNANGFATDLCSAEDWDLWLRLAGRAAVAASSMVSTHYLMRPGSLSSRQADRIRAIEAIAGRYRSSTDPGIRRALRKVRARLQRATAEMARAEARFGAAARAEFVALLHDPAPRPAQALLVDMARGLRGAAFPSETVR